jgi:hypothetical protein
MAPVVMPCAIEQDVPAMNNAIATATQHLIMSSFIQASCKQVMVLFE